MAGVGVRFAKAAFLGVFHPATAPAGIDRIGHGVDGVTVWPWRHCRTKGAATDSLGHRACQAFGTRPLFWSPMILTMRHYVAPDYIDDRYSKYVQY